MASEAQARDVSQLIAGQDPEWEPDAKPEPEPEPEQEGEAEPEPAAARVEDLFGIESDKAPEVEPEQEDKPVTVKDLAEKLGVDAKDLYDELQIPLGDDTSITLGQFKDRVKDLRDIDATRQEVTESRDKYERDLMSTRAEINALINVIPPEIRAQVMSAAQDRSKAYEQEQRAAVLEAIPDWNDSDIRAKDRDRIVAMGSEYGFSEPEITYTQDARTLRMLNDFMRLRERVAGMDVAAKRKPGQVGKSPAGRKVNQSSRRLAQAVGMAKASRDSRTKSSVISELIKGQ